MSGTLDAKRSSRSTSPAIRCDSIPTTLLFLSSPFPLPDLSPSTDTFARTNQPQYGLVYPGVGWVLWRSPEYLPRELVFNINYLGADQASFTLNFSKGASQVIGQYYQLIRLGRRGYHAIMSNLTRVADYLSDALREKGFVIMSRKAGKGLPLVAFRFAEEAGREYDEFALAHQLRVRGWIVPAYTMAPHTDCMKMLRVVVREDFSRSRCDNLIADIRACIELLDNMDRESIKKHEEYVLMNNTASGRATHNNPEYQVSLTLPPPLLRLGCGG